MADFLKGFMNFFKFSDDDDYEDDDYDEAEEETAAAVREKEVRQERISERKVEKSSSGKQQGNSYTEVPTRRGRQSGETISNVVPIHKTPSGLEV